MEKAVFITRDSDQERCVEVWVAEQGIVKLEGCVMYYGFSNFEADGAVYFNLGCESTLIAECCERYGTVPHKGQAWLVEDKGKYWQWTRVDHNMCLLDDCGKVIGKCGGDVHYY